MLVKTQGILSEHKKEHFYCEGSQTVSQVSQSGCGASILEGIQNSSGRGPGQPAAAAPPPSRGSQPGRSPEVLSGHTAVL